MLARFAKNSMHITNPQIINLLYTYSYFILFPLVVIEGPIVTIIAGFLVSINFLSGPLAYITIVLGDLVGDYFYYSIGRWWFNSSIHKFLEFIKVDIKKIEKLKSAIKNNKGKVLFFGKLSHAIGGPILIAAGLAEVPVRDFLWFNFWATLPKSLVFLLVGYYFGGALSSPNKVVNWSIFGLTLVTLIIISLYKIFTKISDNIIYKS